MATPLPLKASPETQVAEPPNSSASAQLCSPGWDAVATSCTMSPAQAVADSANAKALASSPKLRKANSNSGLGAALRKDPTALVRRPNGDDAFAMRMSLVAALPPPKQWVDAPLHLRLMTEAKAREEEEEEEEDDDDDDDDDDDQEVLPPTMKGVVNRARSGSGRRLPKPIISPCAWRRYEMRTHVIGEPFPMETPLFKGTVLVRADKTMFRGHPQEFMVTVQGKFKEIVRFDELVSGYLFSDTLHHMKPKWLIEMAVNFARRFYYPVLEGSILDAEPFLSMPLVLAPDSLHVAEPGGEPPLDSLPQESTKLLGGRFKDGKGDKKRRRTLLNNTSSLRSYHYNPEYVYTFYFTGSAFLPRTFELKLPGIGRWDLVRHLGCQPVCGLAWHRRTSVPVVAGELWHLRNVESLGLDRPDPPSHPVHEERRGSEDAGARVKVASSPSSSDKAVNGNGDSSLSHAPSNGISAHASPPPPPPPPPPASSPSGGFHALVYIWRAFAESWWLQPLSKPLGAVAFALQWFLLGDSEVNATIVH